jgi:hypothetical protein
MNTYQYFLRQNESLREQCKKGEYVRVEVQGIEAIEIKLFHDGGLGDTIIAVGFDIHDVETVLVFPASHFSARLAIVPKQKERPAIGFKLPEA